MSIGILGGGLSGTSLQYFLKQDSMILEKEERLGGLCRTFCKDNFQYDIGGHILFSKNDEITSFYKKMLSGNINKCRRNNRILFKGRYVKYPFENGLSILDKEDIFDCLMGFIDNRHPKPENFHEWIYYTFGDGLAEKYLVPYNRKIWKTPLRDMDTGWVERVPRPPVEDIVKSALGIETEGYVHQLYFSYPLNGGIESFFKTMIKEDSVSKTGFDISGVYRSNGFWTVTDGTNKANFNKLISTIPIKELVKYLENVPEEIMEAAKSLRHNNVRVVMIGVNNESLLDKSAVYIPDTNIIPHRVCYMGYFSRNTVPKGMSSLIAETTVSSNEDDSMVPDDLLIEKTVDGLHKAGIINKNEITAYDIKNIEYGYVVYDSSYKRNIRKIKDYVEDLGIVLHGRFAEFEYINMDEVIKRSMILAKNLNVG